MKRSASVRLKDILDTIEAVREMTEGVDFASYSRDFKLRRAVERCIEIISEASRHIPADSKARFPDTPWQEIAAIGNLLRHEYQRVDDHVLWKLAARDLPALRLVVRSLLEAPESSE